jgi:class 3 adenylate cyclase/tetratricopeptide (TPR) repeat protein
MDIAAWLRGLGLEQYAPAFAENHIRPELLPELTSDDLKELGVASVGHRREILAAIARSLAVPSGSADVSAPEATAAAAAERRQLTVLFCDLVGSTALSARLDPEELRDIFGAYHACVRDAVARFAGYVAKLMGDGVLAYYGYPQAHEDDAERAVRAALAIIAAVGRLRLQERLEVRLGVASGLVVVGDLIGEGDARERGVVGETPNLAARLQALAPANGVIIADATRRQIGGLFHYRDLGPVEVKGLGAPVRAWQVLDERMVESRFEALRGEALTPFVGREEEIELLLRGWRRAVAGEGQTVLLNGEPGIGKSRLVTALRERLTGEDHTRVRYFCSPHHQDSALHPFIAQLERAAGFTREYAAETKLDKIEALLAPASPSPKDLALFAELLSLPSQQRYPPPALSPQRKKEETFAAVLRQLVAVAQEKPVLIVFEDLHWIDPSSRELLDRMIVRAADLPVFVVATYRPEFVAPWSGLPQVTTMTLSRFDRSAGAAMVERIAAGKALSGDIAAEIVARAGGVPLFVEELTKAVLEAGGSGEGIENTLAGALASSAGVPPALHAPLMARLDRLGSRPKEVAQIAATIGREFAYELLASVALRPADEIEAALGRLNDAGLVFCRGAPPAANYFFNHALVRDAAYASLLRRRREELHARIAAVLEADFPDAVEAQPELLAQHFTEAGFAEQAIEYWRRAGERAVARSANLEAIAHLTRGIAVLKTLPESALRDERELALQVALIAPLWASRGLGSSEVELPANRALELSRRIAADTPAHFWALYGVSLFYHVRGVLPLALDLGEQLLGVAERLRDAELLAYGHFNLGNTLFWFGELTVARSHLDKAIALYDPACSHDAAFRVGNCASNSHSFLGRILWHLGYPDQALRCAEEAVSIAGVISHPFGLALALSWAAALHQLRGEAGRTREVAERDLALATEQIIPFFAAHAMVLRGWAFFEEGRCDEGIARLREGVDAYRATGANLESPHWLTLLAEGCGKAGRTEEALDILREALAQVERSGIRYHEAEMHRLEGELRLGFDGARSEVCFQRAIGIARAQQAKSWELRAALSLARLWRDQGKPAEAHALLAPVYNWFTEGFGTPVLLEAKALLDELGSNPRFAIDQGAAAISACVGTS